MRKYIFFSFLLIIVFIPISVVNAVDTGFVWLDSPDEVDLGSTLSAWVEDQDLSDDGVPSTATGVILGWVADTTSDRHVVARGSEDTNDYRSDAFYCEMEDETWRMQIVKLGSNKYIDTWREDVNSRLYVFAYTVGNDPSYRTVPEQISVIGSGWRTYTAPNVDADTDGIILFIQTIQGLDMDVQVRAVGSSNDQPSREWEEYACGMFVVKIDGSDQFQIDIEYDAKIYLVGETHGGSIAYYTNYVDIPDPSLRSWVDRDLDDYITVPSGASGAFFWCLDSSQDRMLGLVKNGGTFPTTRKDIGGDQQIILGTGIDSSNIFDAYYEAATSHIYLEAVTLFSSGGGETYNAYPSQTISWAGNAYRDCALNRLGEQGLVFLSEAIRTWSLTRVLDQGVTFTFSALGDITKVFSRFVNMAFTVSLNSYREWILTRSLSQSLSLVSNTDRTISLTKIAEQLLTLSTESYRGWTLTRSLSQGLSVIANSFRVIDAERLLSQSLTLISDAYRTSGWIKMVSQAMTLSVESLRNWSLTRIASQTMSFTFNTIADLTQVVLRVVSLALNLSADSERGYSGIRLISQTVSMTLNSYRGWTLTRIVTQPITTIFNTFRMFAPIRTVAQSITVNMNANRIIAFLRESTQSLTMILDIFIKYVEGSPPVGTNFVRIASAGFNLGLETLRTLGITRVAENQIIIGLDTLRIRGLTRIAETLISIQSGAVTILGEVNLRVANLLITVSADLGVWFTTINELNFTLFAIQIIAFGLSGIYYLKMRGRWEFTIVCTAAWLVSALTVFGANTGHWPIAMFYFLLFLLFTVETYHEVIAEIDFRDSPW